MKSALSFLIAISVTAGGQTPLVDSRNPQTVASAMAAAQDPIPGGMSVRDYPPLQAPPRTGVGIVQRKLSLADTIEMALANNIEIEVEKSNVDSAKEQIVAAHGVYDPKFQWMPLLTDQNTPAGSILQGSGGVLTEKYLAQNFYLRQKVPYDGMEFSLSFENQRTSSTNPFASFTPYLTSRLALSASYPLMRGRAIDQERAQITISKKHADVASTDFEARVIDIITRVQAAYWDLVAARQDVQVKEDSASWAQEQLAINKRLVKSGTLAPVELSASEAELQRRLDDWYTAIGVLTEVENALKVLIAPERKAEIWGDELIPTTEQTVSAPAADDVRAAVETAVKNRPELRSIGVQQQINGVQKDLNADLRKPQLSLVGQYSLNGLGGTLNNTVNPFTASSVALYNQVNALSARAGLDPIPVTNLGSTPGFLVGGYGTALANVFDGRYQSVQAGVQLDLNLRNRTANANYTESLISEKRLKLEKAREEQVIEAEVRNALQQIQTARQRIAAAEASAEAAKVKLESETRLFQTGESTNFLVLTRQNESSESRRRVVVARLELNKSVTRLERAMGTTLIDHNIHVK